MKRTKTVLGLECDSTRLVLNDLFNEDIAFSNIGHNAEYLKDWCKSNCGRDECPGYQKPAKYKLTVEYRRVK